MKGYMLFGVTWNLGVMMRPAKHTGTTALRGLDFVRSGRMISWPSIIGQNLTAIEKTWQLTGLGHLMITPREHASGSQEKRTLENKNIKQTYSQGYENRLQPRGTIAQKES